MSSSHSFRKVFEDGYQMAFVMTGSGEGAENVVREAAAEVAVHPAPGGEERASKLFFSSVRRRALRYPARCELDGVLAKLHAAPEPQRSAVLLVEIGGLSAGDAAALSGLTERSFEMEFANVVAKLGGNKVLTDALHQFSSSNAVPPHLFESAQKLKAPLRGHSRSGGYPAKVAVGVAILLMVATVAWNFFGRGDRMPEVIGGLARELVGVSPEGFRPGAMPLSGLSDHFAIDGFDGFPDSGLPGDLEVVGTRVFAYDGVPVAQAAVLFGSRRLYLAGFPSVGELSIPGGAPWRFSMWNGNALALHEQSGQCLLVILLNQPEDELRKLIGAPPEVIE